jgi:hypothetical protein
MARKDSKLRNQSEKERGREGHDFAAACNDGTFRNGRRTLLHSWCSKQRKFDLTSFYTSFAQRCICKKILGRSEQLETEMLRRTWLLMEGGLSPAEHMQQILHQQQQFQIESEYY